MNVPNVSSITNPAQGGSVQSAQDFKMLESALQSGSLATAQNAFATFSQHLQARMAAGSQPFTANSPAGKDFQTMGTALRSGDISSAKAAFASFKQDCQAPAPSGHHSPGAAHAHKGGHTLSPALAATGARSTV
jgi:hypothetical protein